MAEGFHSRADAETLARALDLAASRKETPKSGGGLDPAFESYLSQLVRYATGEDRHWDEPGDLLDRALGAWNATARREPGEPVIALRLQRADDWRENRLVLDIATDDMAFLVDSVSAALSEAGKPVSFFVNAVVKTARDGSGGRVAGAAIAESMIHAEMDPPVDNAEIGALEAELHSVLGDVRLANQDFDAMKARLGERIEEIAFAEKSGASKSDIEETKSFLDGLQRCNFTFLGARRYRFARRANGEAVFEHDKAADLGILRDADKRIVRPDAALGLTPDRGVSPAVAQFLESPEPIVVSKANVSSVVHRRVAMDYVGVKIFDRSGVVAGEDRFVGLFTSDIYNRPASEIPILKSKRDKVIADAGFAKGGHNAKALDNILETFPRDEMFETDLATLSETALDVLRLYKRPRTKLFLRRDRFDRFVSAIVYMPRDRFSSMVREAVGRLLAEAFDGRLQSHAPYFGEASLVRVHYIIGLKPGAPEGPGVQELTRRLRDLTRNWSDGLVEDLRARHQGALPQGLFQRYQNAFDAAYRERVDTGEAIDDIGAIEAMGERRMAQRAFRRADDAPSAVSLKLYVKGGPIRLSDLIPQIENLGLSVVQEQGYRVAPDGAASVVWIHDFRAEDKRGRGIDVGAVKALLEDAFAAVLDGRTENDGFNALVTTAGLSWREAWVLRAAAKYLLQAGIPFSQAYIEETLARHPDIARALIAVFHARFNPAGPADRAARGQEVEAANQKATQLLQNVASLDEDRIIRRFLNLIAAMARTNYYQPEETGAAKPYISFKIVSAEVDELPAPRPYREIFVSGPRVDGVHLRFGPVARGGLRWSDRREDFRTEVLGLVKAQRVKNAVIVPTGSKGGFYPKQLPAGDAAARFEEGKAAYKQFIRGLLDITDHYVAGKTAPPPNVVRWDADDPYLVVAADKGTATFSDTANGIAAEYKFWLGDAFASGGSVGYDHKVMGITARGGWEAVKRHFREMGKDIQTEAFTVAGVGDMSGDVFGNGMLLSREIRLVAAFDHRDIFIDPNPDAAISFKERQRLFDTPRTSWADYDKTLISKGGGVYSRSLKSIPLSPEAKALLGIAADSATPIEVMRAILKLDVELFWLGGIGTYVKATAEDHARAGDRASDAVRINASELRAKVIGEGANLGLTQAARIEFARLGGRLNTDAIDNSAGVDSSDHEVNIKILLSGAIEEGELRDTARNDLLKEMTDEVAAHVLRHNYDQTRAISLMEATGVDDLEANARFMQALEADGKLDRAIEGLPDDRSIAALKMQRLGLTRPELSVLLAYAKMQLFDDLVASKTPDDPALERELTRYFPHQLAKFSKAMGKHRLRREIIARRLSSEIVDSCGAAFAHKVGELTGAGGADVALAYEAARRILDLGAFADAVDSLDAKAPAALQTDLLLAASTLLGEQVLNILNDVEASEALSANGVDGLVRQYKEPIQALKAALPSVLPPPAARAIEERAMQWRGRGAPEALAREAALMPAFEFAFEIVNLARRADWPAARIAELFFVVGARFGVDAARSAAERARPEGHFERLAARRLLEELTARQSAIAAALARGADPATSADALIADWRRRHEATADRLDAFLRDLDIGAGMSVGKLSLFAQKLAEVADRLSR